MKSYHTLYYLPDNPGATVPLSPLYADARDGVYGYYTIDAFPSYPDVPLHWQMSSATDAMLSRQGEAGAGTLPPAGGRAVDPGIAPAPDNAVMNIVAIARRLTCIKHFFGRAEQTGDRCA